jgi:hypothetical protein
MGSSYCCNLDYVDYDLAIHAEKEIVRLQSGLRL